MFLWSPRKKYSTKKIVNKISHIFVNGRETKDLIFSAVEVAEVTNEQFAVVLFKQDFHYLDP